MTPQPEDVPTRLLVVDPTSELLANREIAQLPELLQPGDLLVVNDAATMPASLAARSGKGEPLELRLLGPDNAGSFGAVLLGAGDHRTRTEDRLPPPRLAVGERLRVGPQLTAAITHVSERSPRLVELRFDAVGAELWSAIYAWGKPVQYANQPAPLALWSVQTAYASRPWASEMPSAGRPLSLALFRQLRSHGVEVATLTHAAGLSATGDPAIDRALPLPERYDIPASTVAAVARTRTLGGRVIAVGTSVVRALESAYLRGDGQLQAGEAIATLRIEPAHTRHVVDGLLTGIHSPEESHFALLGAFVPPVLLLESHHYARQLGYREHEFGDSCLVLAGALGQQRAAA